MPRVLTLEGDGAERGAAYGEGARALIVEAAARWESELGERAGDVLHDLVDASGFAEAVRRLDPSLAEEVEGIARGSGVERRRVWALNLLDESWWVARGLRGRGLAAGGCSVLGVAAGGDDSPLIAQNMDLPVWVDGLQVLLDVRPTDGGQRVLAPAYAGIVATNALNEHGVGVCVNTLSQLPTSRQGVPVAFVIRHLAAQRTLADAVAVARTLPHASGQNYLIGSAAGIADLECGAGSVVECAAVEGRIAHTNHPLGEPPPDEGGVVAGSGARLDALRERLGATGAIDRERAAATLSEWPLRRDRGSGSAFTFYSAIMELTDEPVLHLSDGPPSSSDYTPFRFTARTA